MAPMIRLALLITALAFAFLATHAYAEDDESGPEMGQSLDPDDLTVEGEDLDGLEADSRDPDDLVGESEDPDDVVEDSEHPDDLVVESDDLDARVSHGYELDDLREDSGSGNRPDSTSQLVAEPSPPGPNDGSQVHAAWRAVQAAERNMEASNDVYANMMANDYPRGERRARIMKERRAAFEEVNQARRRYNELRGN